MKKPIKNQSANNSAGKTTSWDSVAGWYDEMLSGDDTYQSKVILPNLLRLLPPSDKPDKKILDIACGQGFFARSYAEAGAAAGTPGAEVLGVDISPELIKRAKTKAPENVRFEVAPANKISPAKSGEFDGALIVLALQNIKEMAETTKEAHRALKPGGKLVIVLNHPFFRIPKASAWGFDAEADTNGGTDGSKGKGKGLQYRRVDRYGLPFSTEIDMTPGADAHKGTAKNSTDRTHTISFHRPLQDYFKALTGAGFSVVGLEEWISHKKSQPGPRAEAEDQARKEFPLFLTVVAQK